MVLKANHWQWLLEHHAITWNAHCQLRTERHGMKDERECQVQYYTLHKGHCHWSRLWAGWNINLSTDPVVCEVWNFGYSWYSYFVSRSLYLLIAILTTAAIATSTITIVTLSVVVLAGPSRPARGPWESLRFVMGIHSITMTRFGHSDEKFDQIFI